MTWVANGMILVGMWLVGRKCRSAFLWSAGGETIWTACSVRSGQYDLAFICGVFVVMALLNYRRWGRDDKTGQEGEPHGRRQ